MLSHPEKQPHSYSCIEVSNISFSFRQTLVLTNISFQVQCGDYLGIIGPNGGGKTTLLKLILGILKPTSGSIRVFGSNPFQHSNPHVLGYVPQRISIGGNYFPATVAEVVRSGRTGHVGMMRQFSEEDEKIVSKALEVGGIVDLRDRVLSDLSGGQRQRVFIARALARQPKILILDEPTIGVDIAAQEKFYDFLAGLNRNHQLTVILVSHDIDVIAKQVKYVLCLNTMMICHVKAQDFVRQDFLQKLYGEHVKFVVHHG